MLNDQGILPFCSSVAKRAEHSYPLQPSSFDAKRKYRYRSYGLRLPNDESCAGKRENRTLTEF